MIKLFFTSLLIGSAAAAQEFPKVNFANPTYFDRSVSEMNEFSKGNVLTEFSTKKGNSVLGIHSTYSDANIDQKIGEGFIVIPGARNANICPECWEPPKITVFPTIPPKKPKKGGQSVKLVGGNTNAIDCQNGDVRKMGALTYCDDTGRYVIYKFK